MAVLRSVRFHLLHGGEPVAGAALHDYDYGQSIDRSYEESALLDGANWFQRTRYIIVPAIRPIITPAVINTVFTTFKTFDVVYLLTQQAGAKTGSGFHTILTYAYENAFITNNYGYSSAISIIIFILLIVFSARFQLREEGDL